MNRLWLGAMMACGGVLLPAAGTAQAQNYGRPGYYNPSANAPRLSPYLDITRGGNPGINYFLGTVPEIERRQNQALFSGQIRGIQSQIAGLEEADNLYTPLAGTGHNTAFGNTAGYFPAGGRQVSAGAARPATAARKR